MSSGKSSRITVIAGLAFVTVILGGLMYFAGFWRAGSSYEVSAYVRNARGIAENSTVFVAGLPVGIVKHVERSGPNAILELRVDRGVKPLPVDSEVKLGLRSLAGEANVVLTPGRSSEMVPNGGSLSLSRNRAYTEVDQILTALAGRTRGNVREFFQGVGDGVDGQGRNLNRTLDGFAELVNESPPLTRTLADQRTQVADIVENFGNIMDAISDRSDATRRFASGARKTFRAIAARSDQLRGTLHELRYGVEGAQHALDGLTPSAPSLERTIRHLARTMLRLEPTLDLLQPASAQGLTLLRELGGSAPQLQRVLKNLRKLEPSSVKALPALRSTLCQVRPMVEFLAPYGRDIAAFFQNFGGANTAYVPGLHRGHMLPTVAKVDPPNLFRGISGPPPTDALNVLFNSGIFRRISGSKLGYHQLLPPGEIADPKGRGIAVGTAAEWGKKSPHPHVKADC